MFNLIIIALIIVLVGITCYLISKARQEIKPEELKEKETDHPDSFFHKEQTYEKREEEKKEEPFFKRKED